MTLNEKNLTRSEVSRQGKMKSRENTSKTRTCTHSHAFIKYITKSK